MTFMPTPRRTASDPDRRIDPARPPSARPDHRRGRSPIASQTGTPGAACRRDRDRSCISLTGAAP